MTVTGNVLEVKLTLHIIKCAATAQRKYQQNIFFLKIISLFIKNDGPINMFAEIF